MTFEMYMQQNFPDFDLSKEGEVPINGVWLKRFWLAAQENMLHDALDHLRADNPCRLVVLSHEEAAELVRKDRIAG